MADTPLEPRIEPIDIEEEVKRSYLDYAMSVIVGRALPDARDGLKPVHRRILWGMQEEGARPGTPYKKSARLVGAVMGKYHPHGDTAIYDALARMAQDFAMRHPLVDGKGNFGSVDGDAPASMRYCVTGDTLIRTMDGTIPIADIAPAAAPNSDTDIDLKVVGRHGEPARATRFFHSGTHPVLRLRTREGYEVTGTVNHPLLCLVSIEGAPDLRWKRLDQIRPGDHVAMLRNPPVEAGALTEREWQRAFLAGALVSEGWLSEKRAGFNNLDEGFFNEVVAAFDAVVGGPRYISRRTIRSGSVIHEIDVHNMTALRRSKFAEMVGNRSEAKRVPSFVWRGSPEAKATFLQALFEGDGSCSCVDGTIMVSYSSRSERLARDIQQLLLEFGIIARRCRDARMQHRVYLSGRRDVRLFSERVGFYGRKQERLARLLAGVPRWAGSPKSRDYVPHLASYVRAKAGGRWRDRDWLIRHNIDRIERWEQSGEEILTRIADPDVRRRIEPLVNGRYYFAEVVAAESAGEAPVYSFRVETEDHAFIGNGFVNHNTEARLAPIAMELLNGIDEETVDFIPNYDGEEQEPLVVPARFPNLLVNGSTGIAVGMATNIPPHNLGEVIGAAIAAIDDPDITPAALMKHVKGPDFPGGGIIMGRQGIKDAYTTGRGSIKVRARATIEESKSGKTQIVVTQLPYMVSGDRVLAKVAELVDKKIITGITPSAKAVRNESNRQGLRLVIELKREAIPQVVLNNLFKHTQLQDSFGVIMLALVDGVQPRVLNLAQAIRVYIEHQVDVVTRRTRYRLRKAEERAHVLEGLLVALKNLDAVIKLIRGSKTADDARQELMKRFKLTEIQANAILDMQLRRLAALERQKIEDEHKELLAKIKEYKAILADPKKVRRIVKDELAAIKEKYADKRRTEIRAEEADIDVEDLIPDDEVVVSISRSGYIKRVPSNVYRTQGRGGKGIRGQKPKEGDIVEHLLTTTNHAYVLFFSSRGKVYRIKAHEIPEKDRTSRGISIRNLLPFSGEDSLAAVIDTRDYETHKYLVIATKKGVIKKTAFQAYDSSRRDGIIAVKLRPDDEVVQVKATSGEDELILVSRKGQSVVFNEQEVRPMGRDASGVIGIRLGSEDEVVAFDVVDPNGELLIVTDAGFGKRTLLTQYPRHHRGGKGIKTAKLTSRRGTIEGAAVVRPGHEVFLISSAGDVIRVAAKDISRMGRDTQGVRVMRLGQGVTVSAMARVVADDVGNGEA